MKVCTTSPRWLRVSARSETQPRSERDWEGLTAMISPNTVRMSPGLVGLGHLRFASVPIIPPASGIPLSTSNRIVMLAVCQPLAAKPSNMVAFAFSGSM